MRSSLLFLLMVVGLGCTRKNSETTSPDNTSSPSTTEDGMVWIPGGEFLMGTDDNNAYDHERPAHRVRVKGFWMDVTEVTNAQFEKFVDATHYVTVAERKPVWEELSRQLPPGTPKPPDSVMVAGSLVFVAPKDPVMLNDYSQWWKWTPGADWRHPEGPTSDLKGREHHPVVHMAYDDAVAYCKWANKRLPTEAEWEFASREGKDLPHYDWESGLTARGKLAANTFQGSFPVRNLREDGFDRSSPVRSFPANAYGLYDMIGNVWEWTTDWYDVNYYKTLAASAVSVDPPGPERPYDPDEPYAVKRVSKGGSFLCSSNYCVNYRSSARQGTAFDSGSSNIGFRCVRDK